MSWQIVTKQGDKRDIPDLFAYAKGIFFFDFFGDETYTDPFDSSVWVWENYTNDVDEILTVTYNGVLLIPTYSLADCEVQDGSFFWDDSIGRLYVHWFDFWDDFYANRALASISAIIAGFANGYSRSTKNTYDGVFYDPVIVDLAGFSKKADLTKLGLVTYEDSSLSLIDQKNELYQLLGSQSVGIPLWVYLIDKDDTELTNDKRIFTGIYNGYRHDRKSITYQVVESRFFQNVPVCPNTASVKDYPNIGDSDNEIIPVAWGQIRRGRMLLTNEDALTEGASGTAIFLVADSSLGAVKAISNVYDEAGEIQSITSTNLTTCTVEVTKPIGVSPGDLKNWTWEGQGYNITGTYNNGLDIIKAAYLLLAKIAYTASTFDTATWEQETIDNAAPVGLSIQSEKGFVEEIIEPITTSLQGIVEILGDGRISFARRDTAQIPITDIPIIKAWDQVVLPEIEVSPKETVSELQVLYSPNFKSGDKLSLVYSDEAPMVIRDYGINRRDPISPVDTVLVNESDVIDLAIEIMETSASPIRKITTQSVELLTGVRFFAIVGIDTGTFKNENIEYGELLVIDPDYNEFIQNIEIRVIPGYVPLAYIQGEGFSDYEIDMVSDGYSDYEIDNVSTGYSFTTYG